MPSAQPSKLQAENPSQEGELSIERKLEKAHATRELILDRLMHLEDLYRRQHSVSSEDRQTLQDGIESEDWPEQAKAEAKYFLEHEQELIDMVRTTRVYLQLTNEIIGEFESQAGFTEEELAARAAVRDQHFETH